MRDKASKEARRGSRGGGGGSGDDVVVAKRRKHRALSPGFASRAHAIRGRLLAEKTGKLCRSGFAADGVDTMSIVGCSCCGQWSVDSWEVGS